MGLLVSKTQGGIEMTCDRCDGTGEIQFHFGNYDGIENAHCHKTLTCPDCGMEESK